MTFFAELFSREAAKFIRDRQIEPSSVATRHFHLLSC
jgi:hypothetical protein